LVLDALEQAIWTRGRDGVDDLSGLVCHHDAGSQYTSIAFTIAFTERLAAAGAAPSVGTIGDALDNALAESQIGLFKTELIRRRGPGRTSTTWSWPPCNGSTGTTTGGCTPPATTSPRGPLLMRSGRVPP
jgi:putative transposase